MAEKVTLDVQGMSCDHCVMTVQKALSGIEGVKSVKVNLRKKEAQVKYEGAVRQEDLVSAVEEAGYTAAVQ